MASVTIANKGGKQYVLVTESYRKDGKPRSRVLETHGNLANLLQQDPEYLEKLRARIAKQNELKKQSRLQGYASDAQKLIADIENKLHGQSSTQDGCCTRYNLGSALLWAAWKQLTLPSLFAYRQSKSKIEYSYGKAAFLLCNERILRPGSKRKAYEAKNENIYPFDDLTDVNAVYRVLDRLSEDKEAIIKRLNNALAKLTDRDKTLAFYDVTTYSFESRQADGLRGFGMSKDHRAGEVQVVLGLVIDQNGIPVDYELFPGSTSEFGTMVPIIKRLVDTHKIKRCIVVADRGLNSSENLLALQNISCDFVIAQKVKNCSEEQKAAIFSEEGWHRTFDPETGEVLCRYKELNVSKTVCESKVSSKNGCRYPGTKVIGTVDVRWVVSYSSRRAQKDLSDIERALEKAEKALASKRNLSSSHGYKSYIEIPKGSGSPHLNRAKIENARKWAGYYAVCTNRKDLTPEQVTKIYRQLWRIEDCFRISKSMLETRPCFVWSEAHIRGHFVSCYISLVLEKFMLYKLKKEFGDEATIERMLKALRDADMALLDDDPARPVYLRLFDKGLFDKACSVFGLTPVNKMEERITLSRKLGLRQLNQKK